VFGSSRTPHCSRTSSIAALLEASIRRSATVTSSVPEARAALSRTSRLGAPPVPRSNRDVKVRAPISNPPTGRSTGGDALARCRLRPATDTSAAENEEVVTPTVPALSADNPAHHAVRLPSKQNVSGLDLSRLQASPGRGGREDGIVAVFREGIRSSTAASDQFCDEEVRP
jgi:hypothetical protein